ncbi:MAG: ATP-binding cassette domain-containing protein [Alphaproteobacteria bacterium]|nr:ATP-binding cassette domain-containing protein [Alphaproteobacteria bacterium]
MNYGDSTRALHRLWLRADVMAASLGINMLALALPIAILQMYDRVIRHHALSTLVVLTIAVFAAFALEFVLRVLRARIMSAVGARYDHHENCRMVDRLLSTDIGAFSIDTPGTHADRFQAIQTIRAFYCQAGALLADVPFIFVFVALIGIIAGWMAAVPLILFAAFAALGLTVARKLMLETGRRELSDVKRHNFMVECISGIATVKALGLEAPMQRRHERLQEESADAFGAIARVTAQTQSIAGELAQAASVLTVAIGAIAVVNGALTIGGLAATTILTGRLLQPVLKGLGLWARYPFIRLAEEKMRRMEDLTPQMTGELAFPKTKNGVLKLESVSFRYPKASRNAVDGVSLEVPARSYIGIVGETGSGRTTLLKVMNALLTPHEGRVRYDDVPLSALAPQELRRQIALLPTSPTIYAGTLLENLTLFEDGPAKRRALALCRVLGLADYVGSLSRGLDTPLTGSSDTPMGIAQRISIVRSLAQSPRIVLFDTANAALDHDADRMLLAYFERQKGKRAAVFVTDRPSYLRMCDTIYEMVDGRLRLRGTDTTARAGLAS